MPGKQRDESLCLVYHDQSCSYDFRSKDGNPSELMRALKTYTSNSLQKQMSANTQESRREWMLWLMERAASKMSNVKHKQFWLQDNKPIELRSNKAIDQKLDYIHMNPARSHIAQQHATETFVERTKGSNCIAVLPYLKH